MNLVHGKLGTIPETLQLFRRYNLRVGLAVKYRPMSVDKNGRWTPRDRHWYTGIVERINNDGYTFVARM